MTTTIRSTLIRIKNTIVNAISLTLVFLLIIYTALLNLRNTNNTQDYELKLQVKDTKILTLEAKNKTLLQKLRVRDMKVHNLEAKNKTLLQKLRDLEAAKVDLETKLDSTNTELAKEREQCATQAGHIPYLFESMRISGEKITSQENEIKKQKAEISKHEDKISSQRAEIRMLTHAVHFQARELHVETMAKRELQMAGFRNQVESRDMREMIERQNRGIAELIGRNDQLVHELAMSKRREGQAEEKCEEVKKINKDLEKRNEEVEKEKAALVDECSEAVRRLDRVIEKDLESRRTMDKLRDELEQRKAEAGEDPEEEDNDDDDDEGKREASSDGVAGYVNDIDWFGCWVNADDEAFYQDETSGLDPNASAPDAVEKDEGVVVPAEAKDEYDELYD